jgi:hypothetical protein
MDIAGLAYGYCSLCWTILLPPIIAGYTSSVPFTIFEKRDQVSAKGKLIVVAITSWVIIQLALWLLVAYLGKDTLVAL